MKKAAATATAQKEAEDKKKLEQYTKVANELKKKDKQAVQLKSDDKITKVAQSHADEVRNEGIENIKAKEKEHQEEIDLEIEAPGAANQVAEEGSLTIQNEAEYKKLTEQLEKARAKPENKIGPTGFKIALKNPKEFQDTMKIIVLHDAKTDEKNIKMEKFETKNPT